MSASSCCVTCGIVTQLRCRLAPDNFLIRESARVSISPNLLKSTNGICGNANPPAALPAPEPDLVSSVLTKPFTSASVMRPLRPEPFTRLRSTPNSRASLRIEGLACTCEGEFAVPALSLAVRVTGTALAGVDGGGASAGAAFEAGTAETGLDSATGAVAVAAGATGTGAPAASSTIATTAPMDTLSPSLTLISFTTPLCEAGTSIVALSLSSETRESSFLMVSPTLTKISITGISVKSPISGTFNSTRFATQILLIVFVFLFLFLAQGR